jgi:hypothetical protein
MGRPRGPACAREPWKRTGPGGPPGLQNRSPPADRGRAGFDSQALPPAFAHFQRALSFSELRLGRPAFAHFQPALSLSELRLGRPAFARRLSRRSDARTVVHPQHREGGPEAPASRASLMASHSTRPVDREAGRPFIGLRLASLPTRSLSACRCSSTGGSIPDRRRADEHEPTPRRQRG